MSPKRNSQAAATASGRKARRSLEVVEGLFENAEDQAERLLYDKVRLGILSALSVTDTMSFVELKAILRTTDGNLSTHARKLDEVGYIACEKRFEGRVPRTEYSLTSKGKRALSRHIKHLERLISVTKGR